MHEREAAEHGLRCLYQLIDLDLLGLQADALPELLRAVELMGFSGLNITHPCKQLILPLLNDLTEDARAIGAVNTVVLRGGKRMGHNTDWLGFRDGFLSGLPDASLANVVQLGAGGAGAAVAYSLLHLGAGRLTIIDPCASRCADLVERYRSRFGQERIHSSTDIEASLAGADGLVHATPSGMASRPGLPLPASLLRRNLWVAEIVYFPLETELLRAARALGCRTLDGSRMAVHQAVEAFRLFSGLDAEPERMHRQFIAQIQDR